jgi:3-oxoacyl-[acyl-carrier protein] reductase
MDSVLLTDKVIIVTGGAQGIGLALAKQVVALGGCVALVDLDRDLLAAALASFEPSQTGTTVRTYCGNICDAEFVEQTVASVLQDFGNLHGLINNAGIVRAAMAQDMSLERWNEVLNVNLTGAFICLQAVANVLIDKANNGDPNPGSIVNVSSAAGRRGTIGQINYGAAKSGVLGLTMCAAREWGRYNINVNSVCFGMVETTMTETIRQEKFRDKYLAQIPLGRFSTPDDVAPATCFLLTNAAQYITGQQLSIDGGYFMSA